MDQLELSKYKFTNFVHIYIYIYIYIYIIHNRQYIIINNTYILFLSYFRMAKTAISKGLQMPITDGFEIEKQCYNTVVDSKDRIEGLAAFGTKRMPIYQGV